MVLEVGGWEVGDMAGGLGTWGREPALEDLGWGWLGWGRGGHVSGFRSEPLGGAVNSHLHGHHTQRSGRVSSPCGCTCLTSYGLGLGWQGALLFWLVSACWVFQEERAHRRPLW